MTIWTLHGFVFVFSWPIFYTLTLGKFSQVGLAKFKKKNILHYFVLWNICPLGWSKMTWFCKMSSIDIWVQNLGPNLQKRLFLFRRMYFILHISCFTKRWKDLFFVNRTVMLFELNYMGETFQTFLSDICKVWIFTTTLCGGEIMKVFISAQIWAWFSGHILQHV